MSRAQAHGPHAPRSPKTRPHGPHGPRSPGLPRSPRRETAFLPAGYTMQEPPRRFKGERYMKPLLFPALLVGILLAPLRADEPKSDTTGTSPAAREARPVAPVVAEIDKAIRAQLQPEKIPA